MKILQHIRRLQKIKSFLIYVYIFIISYIAFMPKNAGVNVVNNDKLNHILTFIVFVFILYYINRKDYKYIFIYGVSFGIYIECIQYFLKYRSSDIFDLICDIVGILFGLILIKFIRGGNKFAKK